MPPLPSIFPSLPWDILEIIITVVAALGTILITYGIFLKVEKMQDVLIFIGSFGLLIYALFIGNLIFIIAMAGLSLASLVEFIEIILGKVKGFDNTHK